MVSSAPIPSTRVRDIGLRITWLLVLAALLATGAILIIVLVLAVNWYQRVPFPGVLTGPHLLVSDAGGVDWGPGPQVDILDHLVGVDGAVVDNQSAYEQALIEGYAKPDHKVDLTYERSPAVNLRPCGPQPVPSGLRVCTATRTLRFLTPGDWLSLFVLPYSIGLVYFLVGLWVFRQRGNQPTAQMLAMFSAMTSVILVTYFDGFTTNTLQTVNVVAMGLASGALIGLSLMFPLSVRLIDRRPWLSLTGFIPGLILAILTVVTWNNAPNPWAYLTWERLLFVWLGLSVAIFLAMQVLRRIRSESPIVRQQSNIILWGAAAAFLPFLIWVVRALFNPNTPFVSWLYLPSVILFPIAIAYALLRYNQLKIDKLLTTVASYVIAGVLVVGLYLALVYVAGLVSSSSLTLLENPLIAVLFVVLAVIVFDVPRQRLERGIERVFFHDKYDTQALLQNYGRTLTDMSDVSSIINALRQQVKSYFQPDALYVFLLDARVNAYVAQPDPSLPRLPSAAAQCAIDSAMPRWLLAEPGPHYLPTDRALPPALAPDQAFVRTVGAVLYIPLIGHNQLNGWLALGSKRAGQPFSAGDLAFLSALSNQTALALEGAVVFDDLQRRVAELNVLSRISQAVNFTLDPDDILELIYAQTSRVLDTRNFYIALADHKRGTMRFAFYVEDNERLYPDDEWPIDTGLSGEVMRRGQPIVTDDYLKECEKRGVTAGGKPGRAWMGVPLNASNVPMGIMVLSDFQPEATYSSDQLQIFSAIADQAASVLDKGRLYRETAERARQLAVLNEVGSSITSTLDLRTVLTTIVSKAMELLDAEAGSLLLVDEPRNELVFEVTLGPAAPDLRGQRLPMGVGIVGAAAQTRQPQIVNEAQSDARWLSDVDRTTAYSTRALLAVPMIVKDNVIGVIELLNKRSSDNFTEDDQSLLTAFATNAAVAVENARLFTLTDQALASRLDELSTLQEIDRQLNTSLDIQRVLELTLEWGLRVTNVPTGSVGIVNRDDNTIRLLATRNYTYQPHSLPIDKGLAGHVILTGQPILVNDVSQDARYIAAAPATKSQLSVPIKRENEVIGVINLESPALNAFGILQLDTASRLADHAATAIINAQLYEEVKRANDAKSEFVSVVSHELKTPMTSMKGYTDLLAKGMAGPISDRQAQFLNTIRANVDRMSTLVNDLLEASRIETGRLKIDVKPVEINLVIDETLRTTKAQIEERQQTLELDIPENLPRVMADKTRLIQVLTNLLSNAYKYTPNGGQICISVTHSRTPQPPSAMPARPSSRSGVHQAINPGGYLWCAVKDSGVGITPEDQAKLFTKFFRSSDPVVRDQPGTGLGLSITRSLVEMQRGAIWVESDGVPGHGSLFAFSVPVAADGAADAQPLRVNG